MSHKSGIACVSCFWNRINFTFRSRNTERKLSHLEEDIYSYIAEYPTIHFYISVPSFFFYILCKIYRATLLDFHHLNTFYTSICVTLHFLYFYNLEVEIKMRIKNDFFFFTIRTFENKRELSRKIHSSNSHFPIRIFLTSIIHDIRSNF